MSELVRNERGFLAGKKVLIVGVASSRSIAWGVAESMYEQGASLGFTYQTERLRSRVDQIAEKTGSDLVVECDVEHDAHIDRVFERVGEQWGRVDVVVHAVGFAPREQLQGTFAEAVTREGFRIAHDISAYSFAALAKGARPLMPETGSLLTLSYLGAVRAMPFYNVMGPAKASLEACVRYLAQSLGPDGIRVNGISAGPIKTLAAAGISNFRKMLDHVEQRAPLRRTINAREVGNVAAFLCSDLASGVTGEITYVDSGYNILGMSELS